VVAKSLSRQEGLRNANCDLLAGSYASNMNSSTLRQFAQMGKMFKGMSNP